MSLGCILADRPDFGRVFDCGDCGNIHVSLGTVSLTLSPTSFMELVALIQTSAANFELWLERRQNSNARANDHSADNPRERNSPDPGLIF